jgi:hypothetical protein
MMLLSEGKVVNTQIVQMALVLGQLLVNPKHFHMISDS